MIDHVDIIGVRVYGCQATKHNTNISKLEIRNNNKIVLLLIFRNPSIKHDSTEPNLSIT